MSGVIVNCPFCGKMLPRKFWKEKKYPIPKNVKCPECGSQKLWRDGKRKLPTGEIQRYLCKVCANRFSVY